MVHAKFQGAIRKKLQGIQDVQSEAEFEPLKLEVFDGSVEAVIKLNQEFPLLPESVGELLVIDNFEQKLDPPIPRPDPNKKGFGFADADGKEIKIK